MMRAERAVSGLNIDNIFIYVADAVRWDTLPKSVAQRGVVLKSVAGSIHSPTSFATLVTGRYMPSHGVTDFDCRIPESMFTLFDLDTHETRFINSIGVSGSGDPIYSVLDQTPVGFQNTFDTVSEPFVIMERGQGGHAPYGGFEGTAREYFQARKNLSVEAIKEEYRDGVQRDAEVFSSRVSKLESKGLLEDTLVIYTSDHGELLGEGGIFGHNGPIRPELVYVPTVFIHPDLPRTESSGHFNHINLLSTVLDPLGNEVENQSLGSSPDTGHDVAFSFYRKEHSLPYVPFSGVTEYDSVWNAEGGFVFSRSARYKRGLGLIGNLFFSPTKVMTRKKKIQCMRSYWNGLKRFGEPPGTSDEFDIAIQDWKQNVKTHSNSISLNQDAKNRLEDLGYIN